MSLVRLPTSWFTLTRLDLKGRTYAIENEKEEIFVTILDRPKGEKLIVDDTRTTSDKYQYCIADLISIVLIADGCDAKTIKPWIYALRRRVAPEVLEMIAIYLDERNDPLATEIDSLRSRLEKLRMPNVLTQKLAINPVISPEHPLVKKAREQVLLLKDMELNV